MKHLPSRAASTKAARLDEGTPKVTLRAPPFGQPKRPLSDLLGRMRVC
jgi:hypothetical protein